MSMHLHSNWKTLLRRAWSLRLMALAAILTGLEAAYPYLDIEPIAPDGSMAALGFLLTALAFGARLIAQKDLN